jgi:hypothetical protein
MGALLGSIIRVALQVLAGVGIGHFADKLAADKLPAYPAGGVNIGFANIPRLVWIIIFFVAAFLMVRYVGKILKIKLLK